ncbi:pentapeptide repeat-containing protein [Actinopolymorpha pittospori]
MDRSNGPGEPSRRGQGSLPLAGAVLAGAVLAGAVLRGAVLRGAVLRGAVGGVTTAVGAGVVGRTTGRTARRSLAVPAGTSARRTRRRGWGGHAGRATGRGLSSLGIPGVGRQRTARSVVACCLTATRVGPDACRTTAVLGRPGGLVTGLLERPGARMVPVFAPGPALGLIRWLPVAPPSRRAASWRAEWAASGVGPDRPVAGGTRVGRAIAWLHRFILPPADGPRLVLPRAGSPDPGHSGRLGARDTRSGRWGRVQESHL